MRRPASCAIAAATLSLSAPSQAQAPRPLESESFQIGTEGALCEAQGVMLGAARASLFDRKWALICADVDRPIGAAYSWKGSSDAATLLGRGRDVALDCDAPAATDGAGVTVRRCSERGSGLAWHSYSVSHDGWTHVVEGVAAFDGALRLALANLVENRIVPGSLDVVTTGGSGSLAQARAGVGGEQLIGQGYRRNNAGEYTEAEEFFRPDLLDESGAQNAATLAEQRHEATVN